MNLGSLPPARLPGDHIVQRRLVSDGAEDFREAAVRLGELVNGYWQAVESLRTART
jgi:hypothetical protein